ncbi:MAG: arginine--tRNA ligase [Hallerella porci]|uniref:Arginine--tRNA ligase n=1 Tax=Hallerella porci TaxID=1945871 RepID=A0ABX5LKV3_9BACT|nr:MULTISPECIES: arginine--tRNA ligase [Hallerella]MCI5600145.1 arginine--tRNA ligase [Hallerella sp.]MDY3922544.1 arginine--tRNA ligase [Hallerella porci]PWL01891.1 arginyl-tRNA synthetase [Hallerella porci]
MNSFNEEIAKAVAETGAFEKEQAQKLITVPPDTEHGNFTLPCFVLARTLHKAPKQIAEELAPKIELPAGISKVEAVAGYLNFFIDRKFLASSILEKISADGLNYGHAASNGKVICIDYSSPNIGKELAFHHLRSTMIGNSLARIYKASGYKVERINHLGDWGTAFGKLIVMYLRENLPTDQETLDALTVKELNVLYASFSKAAKEEPSLEDEARSAFSKLEKGDAFYHKLWLAFRAATLKELMRIYKMMGVDFDYYTGESFYEDKMPAVIDQLRQMNLLERSEERDVVKLDEYKLNPCLIRKSDGSTLYATRDLAAAIYRKKEYNFDKCLYVVDLGQALHFKQVKLVLKKMGFDWYDSLVHIPFGVILNLIDGKWEKGKTRTGTASLLRDVIEAAQKKILEFIDQKNPELENKELIARQIGISALTFNDLKNHRLMDVKFDWDSALSFEGATGPYVQNAHVRLCSIMRKAGYDVALQDVQFEQLTDDHAYELIKFLAQKSDRIRKACETDEPCELAQYALDIAGAAHKFIHEDRVLGSAEEKSRLFLVKCTQIVLEDVLNLLGLFPVRNM